MKRFRGVRMKVTVKDIARELGVSVGSVSTALNNKEGISENLKKIIKEKADEMGYFPNLSARSLVSNTTNKIALFILSRNLKGNNNNDFLLTSILEQARKNKKTLLLYSGDLEDSDKSYYIRLCKEENVLGAIFLGLRLDDPSIEEIKSSHGFPIVIFDTYLGGESNTVKTSNEIGINRGLDYLYNLGHRRIALITGHGKAQVSKERFDEAKRFLEEKNIFDENLIYQGDFKLETGFEIGKQILKTEKMPTAIFAFNDLMAIGVKKCLEENGLKVPEDISIIGFDNIPLSDVLEMTTIAHNLDKISEEIMNAIIENKRNKKIVVNPELVIRCSCKKINS